MKFQQWNSLEATASQETYKKIQAIALAQKIPKAQLAEQFLRLGLEVYLSQETKNTGIVCRTKE
jgi:hypothetical protein